MKETNANINGKNASMSIKAGIIKNIIETIINKNPTAKE